MHHHPFIASLSFPYLNVQKVDLRIGKRKQLAADFSHSQRSSVANFKQLAADSSIIRFVLSLKLKDLHLQ